MNKEPDYVSMSSWIMKNESFLQKQNRKKENIYGSGEPETGNKWKFP